MRVVALSVLHKGRTQGKIRPDYLQLRLDCSVLEVVLLEVLLLDLVLVLLFWAFLAMFHTSFRLVCC